MHAHDYAGFLYSKWDLCGVLVTLSLRLKKVIKPELSCGLSGVTTTASQSILLVSQLFNEGFNES